MKSLQRIIFVALYISKAIDCLSQLSINNQCLINYTIDTESKGLQFVSCSNSSSSLQKTIQIGNWSICQVLCCSFGNQTAAKFQDCLKHKNSYRNSLGLLEITSIVFLFIIGIFSMTVLIYLLRKFYHFIIRKYLKQENSFFKDIKLEKVTKSIYQIVWMNKQSCQSAEASSSNEKRKEQQTSVCNLCKSSLVNTEIPCGHRFHTECLYSWCQLHKNCPKCPKTRLYYIKFYCIKCQTSYFILEVDYFKKLGPISLSCANCLNDEESKNKVLRYYWIDSQLRRQKGDLSQSTLCIKQ